MVIPPKSVFLSAPLCVLSFVVSQEKKAVNQVEKQIGVFNHILRASSSEPAGVVSSTQSQKRGGDFCAVASSQGMLSE